MSSQHVNGDIKVNSAKYNPYDEIASKSPMIPYFFLVLLPFLCLVGCSDEVRIPSAEQLADFKKAGPVLPSVNVDRLIRARIGGVPLPGEVLEITMPAILHVLTSEEPEGAKELAPFICRVSEQGSITLPVVGAIEVVEKNLAEIETSIVNAYYPEYAATRPSIFVRLVERVESDIV